MARTTNRPATATRLNTATMPLDSNSAGSFDQQDQRSEDGQYDDNAERRENLTAARDQPDNDESRENLNSRENRGGQEFGGSQQYDGDAEQGSREQPPMLSAGVDAFAPVLEAWKQVFKSWSELAETMVKAQQDVFASMIGAANTTAKDITDIKVGDRRDGELAFSGPCSAPSGNARSCSSTCPPWPRQLWSSGAAATTSYPPTTPRTR
jgi:hypothetical protein